MTGTLLPLANDKSGAILRGVRSTYGVLHFVDKIEGRRIQNFPHFLSLLLQYFSTHCSDRLNDPRPANFIREK